MSRNEEDIIEIIQPISMCAAPDDRRIIISGDITREVAGHVLDKLLRLVSMNNEPIDIYLNSDGGCYFSSIAIYDYIKELQEDHGIHISIHANGLVASGAVLIFLAGRTRTAYPNTVFMIHSVSEMGISIERPFQTKTKLKINEFIENKMIELISEETILGIARDGWEMEFKHADIYLDYEQAGSYGFYK